MLYDIHNNRKNHPFHNGRQKGNVSFNNALNTFLFTLYGIRHIVKEYSDKERENLMPPLQARDILYAPSHRQDSICQVGSI